MSSVRSTVLRRASAAACVAAAAAAMPAHAVDLQVGNYTRSGLGAEFVTDDDTFAIAGNLVNVPLSSTPVAVTLGALSFTVGPNCYSCTLTPSFDALVDLTIGGVTRQFDLPYAWSSSGPNDTLTFGTPSPVLFDLAGLGLLTVSFDPLQAMSSPIGLVQGSLTGHVAVTAVPEPGTVALLLSGLLLMTFVARRRQA